MIRVEPDGLQAAARYILEDANAPPEAAAQVAASVVTADLRGHPSHGVRLVPMYADRAERADADVESGFSIHPTANPTVEVMSDSLVWIDGKQTFGHVVGRRAVSAATERASESGVCVAGIRDATHLGRIGEWAERTAEEGMAFLAFVSGQGPGPVAMPGSAQRRLGTNPVTLGLPSFDALPFPIVLDIATSQVAVGKVLAYAARGEPLPETWVTDANDEPVTDASSFEAGNGALRPFGGRDGGYKGFGFALFAELLAGVFGQGTVVGHEDSIGGNAGLFVTIDPTRFMAREEIRSRIEALAEYIRSTEFSAAVPAGSAARGDRALVPGEAEYLNTAERQQDGIPIAETDFQALIDRLSEADAEALQSAVVTREAGTGS